MRKTNLIAPLTVLLLVILGCSEKKDVETVRGRLKLVESKEIGTTVHGSKSASVYRRQFYFNGSKFSPEDFDMVENIILCNLSPNEAVEAFRCIGSYSNGKNSREAVYVLRVANDKPSWEKLADDDSMRARGRNKGEWFGDGKWLIFEDNFYEVETGNRRDIKTLPVPPDNLYFRAVSPDMKTIVYENIGCSDGRGNSFKTIGADANILKACEKSDEYYKNKIEPVYLIDAQNGAVELLELPKEKYPDLFAQQNSQAAFQRSLVWKTDETGRDRLVYPR